MRLYIRRKLHRVVGYLEIIVALIVTVIIALSIINMIVTLAKDPMGIRSSEEFYSFLDDALSLIIGMEFLKMIIIPTSDNLIETLLFAVARHIILDHGTDVMILGTLSVVLLFIAKKFFLSEFEEVESYRFKGSIPVNTINATIQSKFEPDHANETIGEYVVNRLKKENRAVERGASIESGNFMIRIGHLNESGIPKKIFIHPLNKETKEVELTETKD